MGMVIVSRDVLPVLQRGVRAALLHVLSAQQNLSAAHSFVDALVAHLQAAPVAVRSEVVQSSMVGAGVEVIAVVVVGGTMVGGGVEVIAVVVVGGTEHRFVPLL